MIGTIERIIRKSSVCMKNVVVIFHCFCFYFQYRNGVTQQQQKLYKITNENEKRKTKQKKTEYEGIKIESTRVESNLDGNFIG